MITGDTIAAITTAQSEGAIAVIRISGPHALTIADTVFSCHAPPPSQRVAQTFVWGHIHDLAQQVDEGLLLIMRAPHSYTREDVVELQCHGGRILPRKVLRAVLRAGARMADPGEFTYRAFINGGMDLVQAESVNDLIHARSERAVRLAQEQREGHLSKKILELYNQLLTITTDVEATLDFPDDELPLAVLPNILLRLEFVIHQIEDLLKHWKDGHRLREGISLVIAGRPNVGKSSLLNALLGNNRVIVSHQPGTTRDIIEETFIVNGIWTKIFDTAGLRTATCEIEAEGIRRAHFKIQQADLILYVIDASQSLSLEDISIIQSLPKNRCILVFNKADLGCVASKESFFDLKMVEVSSLLLTGIENIKEEISSLVSTYVHLNTLPETVISDRHFNSLSEIKNSLLESSMILRASNDYVCSAHHIRLAMNLLAGITGSNATDDVLSSIFSKFCVGK